MEKRVKNFSKERVWITAIASIIAPFIVFVFTPMVVFGNNINEFLFDWSDFIPLCFGFAFLLSCLNFFGIIFLPEKAYKICLHVLISIDLLVFMQTTYLNGELSLSGDNLGGDVTFSSKIFNLIIWFVVITSFVVLAILKDKKKYIRTGSLILCIVIATTQFISTIVPIISNEKYFKARGDRIEEAKAVNVNYSTYKDIGKYSTTGNIYYFLIDMFDEKYAELAYQTEPTIYDDLTGFTWYKDNLTLYGHTYPAVAYALTGVEHSAEWYNAEYMKKAYGEHNYLTELKDAGYTINLYTDMGNAYGYAGLPDYVNNAEPCEQKLQSKFLLFKKMVQLGLYISAPLAIKNVFGNVTSSAFETLFNRTTKNGIDAFHTNNNKVKRHIDDIIFEETDNKQFTFFHIAGTHDVQTSNQTKSLSATGLTKFSFDIINKFLQNLKDKGLYDEATIVITGDHSVLYEHPAPTALFFKPAQTEQESQHKLKVSTAKVEQKNIMPSIFDSIDVVSELADQKGDKPLHLTDSNERKFIYHSLWMDFTEYVFNVKGSLLAGGEPSTNYELVSQKTYNGRRIYD